MSPMPCIAVGNECSGRIEGVRIMRLAHAYPRSISVWHGPLLLQWFDLGTSCSTWRRIMGKPLEPGVA